MTTVKRRTKADSLAEIGPVLTEFGGHRTMIKKLTVRNDELKKKLMGVLEKFGKDDDKGSQWVEFAEPIAGFEAICRQRRAQILLDESEAERITKESGVYEECIDVDITFDAEHIAEVIKALKAAGIYTKVVTVTERLSHDKIMQVFFAEKQKKRPRLTADDIEAMFTEKITWAFVPREVS